MAKPAPLPPTRQKPWPDAIDPRVDALVTDVIGRVADKWTMLILEALAEHEHLRFTQVGKLVPGISQKMLTQTLRQMERDACPPCASRSIPRSWPRAPSPPPRAADPPGRARASPGRVAERALP